MTNKVLVVGSTVVYDYLFTVEQLPRPGQPAFIKDHPAAKLDKKYPGGTAFNIAVQLATLGEESKLLHPVGVDFPGSEYEQKLLKLGVDTVGLLQHQETSSGFAYLFTNPAGETLIFTYPSRIPDQAIPQEVFQGIEWLVLTPSFGPFQESSLQQYHPDRHKLGVVGMAHPALVKWLPDLDLLSINATEAQQLVEYAGFRTTRELAEELAGILIVTEGKRGCYVHELDGKVTQLVSIAPDRYIDPTGAGDGFAAAVIAGLRRGYSAVEAARIGTVTASYIVEAFGCQTNMPTWREIFTRMKQHDISIEER